MSESTIDLNEPFEPERNLPVKTSSTIVPVTIKQIWDSRFSDNATNSKLIDYVERKEVYIVGMIRNSLKNSYSTMYEIDDGTGIYKVQVVHPEDTENGNVPNIENEPFQIGQYVYVAGRISTTSQEDQREPISVISAYAVHPCKDANQIACHLLQSLYVHLLTLKNNENKFELEPNQNRITNYFDFDDQKAKKVTVANEDDNDSGSEKLNSSPIRLNEIPIRSTPQRKIDIVKRALLRFLANTNSENTIDVKKIISHFSSTFSIDDIQSSLDALSYNGDIVCTGIEEHYFIV